MNKKRHPALPWLLIGGAVAVGIALNWPLSPHTALPSKRRSVQRPPAAAWRAATLRETQAATSSIVAQLRAFKRDDYRSAMFYQSSTLRRRFASLAAFRRMIKAYPQFARYKSVGFSRSLADKSGHFIQIQVDVIGMDNVRTRALYLMALENKIYHVAGVEGGGSRPSKSSLPSVNV